MEVDGIKIDKTDREIIKLLGKNGRIQNNEIASCLSISEGTVRNRIKKLRDSNFLSIRGLINPRYIKNKQIIFLGVHITKTKYLEEAAEYISNLKNVIAVYMITGRYDLFVEVYIEPTKLLNFISEGLEKLDTIASSESFLTLKTYNKWI